MNDPVAAQEETGTRFSLQVAQKAWKACEEIEDHGRRIRVFNGLVGGPDAVPEDEEVEEFIRSNLHP